MGKIRKSQISDATNRTDLSTITNPTLESIATCLHARYEASKVYTYVGSRHIVAVNPLKELSINDDQTSLEYVAAYKDASGSTQTPQSLLDPHLFDLINRVYFHMRRTGSDQNITLR